jgi:hypothetical protein
VDRSKLRDRKGASVVVMRRRRMVIRSPSFPREHESMVSLPLGKHHTQIHRACRIAIVFIVSELNLFLWLLQCVTA